MRFVLVTIGCLVILASCVAKTWTSKAHFLGISTTLLINQQPSDTNYDSLSTKLDENSLQGSGSRKFSRFEEVKSMIEESDTIEEVLYAAEEIPAIQRSTDRAMKIRSANIDDTVLALRVLFKISNIVATSNTQSDANQNDLFVNDLSVVRRIELVADCVSWNLQSLSSEDLVVAAWSLNTIKLNNQAYIEAVMDEYSNRMAEFWSDKENGSPYRLRIEDIAAMIWTVGSHRDKYGWSNITLINELVQSFAEYNGTATQSFAQLDPRMNIRILWAMSLFNILRHHQDFATQGVSSILPYLPDLTPTNKVSTLWCVARARLENASIVVPVIETVTNLIALQPESLREHEVNYVLLSTKIINERMRRLLMDHKCNLTATGKMNSYLTLDEAIILNATEKLMRTIVTQALPSMEQQSFQANLNILRVLSRMELLDENLDAFKACYDRFRAKVEAALSANFNSSTSAENVALISPTDAAGVLEMIATTIEYPGLLKGELANAQLRDGFSVETGKVVAVEGKTRLPKAISSIVEVSNMIKLSSASSHQWHELMGRLGVYISCYRKEISDRASFVHAAWALARMGHALRPLCRKTRTYAEFQQLSDLPIQVLGRLVVVLASEQASSVNNAAVTTSPVTYDLIARVTSTVLARLGEVTLLSDLSKIVFSVAFLRRLPHFNKAASSESMVQRLQNSINATAESQLNSTQSAYPLSPLQKQISLRPFQLMFLSTEEIIGLFWSTRQLAVENGLELFDVDTSSRLIQEIQRRLPVYLVSPQKNVSSDQFTSDVIAFQQQQSINFKESFLLVKSLSNATHPRNTNFDVLKDQACALLLQQCSQLFQPLVPEGMTGSSAARSLSAHMPEDFSAMLSAADVEMIGAIMRYDQVGYQPIDHTLEVHISVLIDALQAFIDLRWYKEEMISICELALKRVVQVLHEHEHQKHMRRINANELHFQYGVLSQLLSIYRELPLLLATKEEVPVGKMPAKKKPATMLMASFPRLHGLFSRFLGTVPASVAGKSVPPAVISPMAPGMRYQSSSGGIGPSGSSSPGTTAEMLASGTASASMDTGANTPKADAQDDDDCVTENSDL
jgi:hypothetical protein